MSDRLALQERAQQGDDRAEAQLLTENAGLIWSIVRRYNGCGVDYIFGEKEKRYRPGSYH